MCNFCPKSLNLFILGAGFPDQEHLPFFSKLGCPNILKKSFRLITVRSGSSSKFLPHIFLSGDQSPKVVFELVSFFNS